MVDMYRTYTLVGVIDHIVYTFVDSLSPAIHLVIPLVVHQLYTWCIQTIHIAHPVSSTHVLVLQNRA